MHKMLAKTGLPDLMRKWMESAVVYAPVRQGDFTIMACMYREDAPDLVFPAVPLGKSVNRFFVRKGNPWRFDWLVLNEPPPA